MKRTLICYREAVSVLYDTANNFIIPYSKTYQDMETAFITGNASKEDIMKDAETLSLDMNLVSELVEQEETDDEEDDDDELFAMQRMCSS